MCTGVRGLDVEDTGLGSSGFMLALEEICEELKLVYMNIRSTWFHLYLSSLGDNFGFLYFQDNLKYQLKWCSNNQGGIESAKFIARIISLARELIAIDARYNSMPVESIAVISPGLKAAKGSWSPDIFDWFLRNIEENILHTTLSYFAPNYRKNGASGHVWKLLWWSTCWLYATPGRNSCPWEPFPESFRICCSKCSLRRRALAPPLVCFSTKLIFTAATLSLKVAIIWKLCDMLWAWTTHLLRRSSSSFLGITPFFACKTKLCEPLDLLWALNVS